jgi:hypothetical protein
MATRLNSVRTPDGSGGGGRDVQSWLFRRWVPGLDGNWLGFRGLDGPDHVRGVNRC